MHSRHVLAIPFRHAEFISASVPTCIVAKILNSQWTFLQNLDYGNNFLHKIIMVPANIQTLNQVQGDGELEI